MFKNIHKQYFKRVLHASLVFVGVLVVASATQGAGAQEVTQGYKADSPLQNGLLVRVKSGSKDTVQALKQEEEGNMFGVVVSASQSPVSISDPDEQQVYVASIGQYDVLVSTQNGQIVVGDGIVVSSVQGVGMKADDVHRVLIGRALANFADNSDAESHVKLSDGRTVAVGRIKVDITVKRNPTYSGDTIAGVPHALSRVAAAITDKPVTALRIYAGLAVLFMCMGIAGAILYSGIHASMTSIGRNPLAKGSIMRNLVSMTLMSLIVVSIGLFALYLILKI